MQATCCRIDGSSFRRKDRLGTRSCRVWRDAGPGRQPKHMGLLRYGDLRRRGIACFRSLSAASDWPGRLRARLADHVGYRGATCSSDRRRDSVDWMAAGRMLPICQGPEDGGGGGVMPRVRPSRRSLSRQVAWPPGHRPPGAARSRKCEPIVFPQSGGLRRTPCCARVKLQMHLVLL